MIVKSYEIKKINIDEKNFFLFYGKNEGLKKEIIKDLTKNEDKVLSYEENEILDNSESFLDNLLTKSLFESQKIIIIKRASDKILEIIKIIIDKNIEDLFIIINAENLEKRSKLRIFFEKDKKFICVPFYPDNEQTLSKLAYEFFNKKKISISQSNINLIINKCRGDRERLLNEIRKVEYFSKNGKKITSEYILKLTNLTEDYSVNELVDYCLAKNKKKTISILNENNFNNEDCILIARIFLNKSKKLLKLSNEFENNSNINLTISSAKPPIFWKDKEITKQHIYKWKPKNIKNLIYRINEIELLLKKNISNSINLITDFIIEQSSSITNN